MPSNVDVVEALLFASDSPLEAERIREVLDLENAEEGRTLVRDLAARYDAEARGLQIVEVGGGYRMVTRPDMAPWLVRLARVRTRVRLSRPALEALAIVAYKQPVSRPEIDAARGVNSEGVLENLLERRLVRIAGRKEAPGRPFLFETTREFLVAFGLRDLADLPKVEGELVLPDLGATASSAAGPGGNPVDGTPSGEASAESASDSAVGASPSAVHADAQTQQNPGPGGTGIPAGR
jgi:segregation and condensation protein B